MGSPFPQAVPQWVSLVTRSSLAARPPRPGLVIIAFAPCESAVATQSTVPFVWITETSRGQPSRRQRRPACSVCNTKYRALRLDHGNFSWPTESTTKKTRVLSVQYNSTNNELVRTNTLVKSCNQKLYLNHTPESCLHH